MKILFAKKFNIPKNDGIILWRRALLDVMTFEAWFHSATYQLCGSG